MIKTATLMVGLPNTGKSTVAKEILKEIGQGQILDPDSYVWEQTSDYQEYMQNTHEAGRQIGQAFWRDLKRIIEHENEEMLIIDRCNVNRNRRKTLLHYLHKHDFEVYCIALENEPFPKDRKGTPAEVVNRLKSAYETPTESEGFEEVEVWKLR